MARYTIGRILPIFKGNWDSTQSYDKLDVVLKGITAYVSLIDNNTTTPSDNSANWRIVCRGATADEVMVELEPILNETYDELSDLIDDSVYYKTRIENTKIEYLTISYDNDKIMSSSSHYVLSYIPVTLGQRIRITATYSEAKIANFGFTSVVPADNVSITDKFRLETNNINEVVVAPYDGYLVCTRWYSNFTDLKFEVVKNIEEVTDFIESDIDKLHKVVDGSVEITDLNIVQGTITTGGVDQNNTTTRIKTSNYINYPTIRVTTKNGVWGVRGYDDNNNYISYRGFYTDDRIVSIEGATKYRLVFATKDNAVITPSDFDSLRIKVYGIDDTERKVLYRDEVINDVITGGEDKALSAEQGKLINTKVDNIVQADGEFELFGNLHYVSGYLKSNDGTIGNSSTGTYVTDYIKVGGYDSISFLGFTLASSNTTGGAFFDENRNYVKGINYDATGENVARDYQIQVPENAEYFRWSVNDTYAPNPYIYGRVINGITIKGSVRYLDSYLYGAADGYYYLQRYSDDTGIFLYDASREDRQIFSWEIKKGLKYRYTFDTSAIGISNRVMLTQGISHRLPTYNDIVDNYRYDAIYGSTTPTVFDFTAPYDGYFHVAYVNNSYARNSKYKFELLDQNRLDSLYDDGADVAETYLEPDTYYSNRMIKYNHDAVNNSLLPINLGSDTVTMKTYTVEAPKTLQEYNVMRKGLQYINIRWTPKGDVPKQLSRTAEPEYYPAGVTVTNGIPYSRNHIKIVGIGISMETFMTSVNNPYSLLYTEVCLKNYSQSAWGFIYRNTNAYAYYGTVCCGFTSAVVGSEIKYSNYWHKLYADNYGILGRIYPDDNVPSHSPIDVFPYLKVGDIFDDEAHSIIVMGVVRDSFGRVTKALIGESTSGNVDGCHFRGLLTRAQLKSYLDGRDQTNYMKAYRHTNLYKNIDYAQSQFVTLTDFGEVALEPYVYNNDICTFAGDKVSFKEGELIVLNYNLEDIANWNYTHIYLYKDGEQVGKYALSSIVQSELPTSQRNHALKFANGLEAGVYEAKCGYNDESLTMSEPTYFDVVPDNVEITKGEKPNEYYVNYSSNDIISAFYDREMSDSLGDYIWYIPDFQFLPTDTERKDGKMSIIPVEQLKEMDYDYPIESLYVELVVKGKYSSVALSPKKIIP